MDFYFQGAISMFTFWIPDSVIFMSSYLPFTDNGYKNLFVFPMSMTFLLFKSVGCLGFMAYQPLEVIECHIHFYTNNLLDFKHEYTA